MENMTYEEAVNELNEIILKLEEGSIPMQQATILFERGKKLIEICYSGLDKAKGKLTEIKETLGKLEEI